MVVSPLSALMKDLVESFKKRDVSVAMVTSESDAESVRMKSSVLKGKYQLVFISPELERKNFNLCVKMKSIQKDW